MPEGGLLAFSLIVVAAISLLDAFTPSSIVVGVLFVVPLLAMAATGRPRDVTWVFAAAALGYGLAAVFGTGTPAPPGTWLHNRILVIAVLVMTAYLVLLMQRRRGPAGRDPNAPDVQEVNRLLMSLIVHDLRSPLTTALHTLDYLEQRMSDPEEEAMIGEARARLRRNLRLVDAFLAVAHADREGLPHPQRSRRLTSSQLADVLHEEVSGFRPEAAGRNKQLLLYHDAPTLQEFSIDLLVMRHALTILLDNAVRYALPGPIRVTSSVGADVLSIAVEDSGPGTAGTAESPSGAGLGLELCGALLRRAGGDLRRVRDDKDGSCFVLRMPLLSNGAAPAEVALPEGFRLAARR